MKLSFIRALLFFGAGAGCAMVVAGDFPGMSPGDFLKQGDGLLVQVADFGRHVVNVREDMVWINTAPDGCFFPPPVPKRIVRGSVDQRLLERGFDALRALQLAKSLGYDAPIRVDDKCQTDPGS